MPALHETLRKQLEKTVIEARDIAEEAATEALKRLAVDQTKLFDHMTPDERELRNKLRAKARQLGDRRDKAGKQAIDHLATECAYEHWHRMLFARFLAENHLLIHDEEQVPVSLEECEELAKEEGTDGWTVAARFASLMLPQIFRPDDPVLAVALAPESKRALEKMLDTLPPDVFTAADSLGWVYQFWQDKRKDEVNASGVKVGADELPAVTQLFTEHYMVLFLLHNTLGAWWAGKVLRRRDREGANKEELSEEQWRTRVALPGCEFDYLRFLPDGKPAAGTFSRWPKDAKDLKILDPCCGSGHFLVAAFDLMVRIRMEEEGLSPSDACDAVLRDNIFGLEIDQRCTQIAAFALALSAWRFPEAGGYRELPELHIACSGIAPHATEEQWLELAEQSGVPMPALGKQLIRDGLRNLHALFSQAPTLGSLIDPDELPGDLIAADYETLYPYLVAALAGEHSDDEAHERAAAAAGMVKAAELLASEYTLVITNVPYLGRRKQNRVLSDYCQRVHPKAKADLATCFLERCLDFCSLGGNTALLAPQNWLFLGTFASLRKKLIKTVKWEFVCRLGPKGFQTPMWDFGVALQSLTRCLPSDESNLIGLDVGDARSPEGKSLRLRDCLLSTVGQFGQLRNPDTTIVFEAASDTPLLSEYATSYQGSGLGDIAQYRMLFWESGSFSARWDLHVSSPNGQSPFSGMHFICRRRDAKGRLDESPLATIRGTSVWGRTGVACAWLGNLPASLYLGTVFDNSAAVIAPHDPDHLAAIWGFCSSPEFLKEVRKINQKTQVANATLVKVPFDLTRWQRVAAEKYPQGLPKPHSDDPTQWLFNGHPKGSEQPLQVGVARLLAYQWPRQTGSCLSDCPALDSDGLETHADDDGIVCIPAVRGERTAADRLRAIMAAALDSDWSPARQEELLSSVEYGGKGIEEWLRNGFFEQHIKLFHQRPFIWHIWDGRKADGFGALVNYHMLDAKLLDRLVYTYLGDWIKRQEQAIAQEESGADARLLAAQQLQEKLKLIAEGEPPYDIFVRWKPIEEQPIGWNPDLNDGVRMNIRPFMEANILRKKPNCKWKKDRGKEPRRPREQYPWFYDENGEFTGDRVNDVHLTNAVKQAARERAGGAEIQQTA